MNKEIFILGYFNMMYGDPTKIQGQFIIGDGIMLSPDGNVIDDENNFKICNNLTLGNSLFMSEFPGKEIKDSILNDTDLLCFGGAVTIIGKLAKSGVQFADRAVIIGDDLDKGLMLNDNPQIFVGETVCGHKVNLDGLKLGFIRSMNLTPTVA